LPDSELLTWLESELSQASGPVMVLAHQQLQQIAGIHYTTLVAMVEGSGTENSVYTMLEVLADGSLRLNGFHKQVNRVLKHA
jgi:hypothetical protein